MLASKYFQGLLKLDLLFAFAIAKVRVIGAHHWCAYRHERHKDPSAENHRSQRTTTFTRLPQISIFRTSPALIIPA